MVFQWKPLACVKADPQAAGEQMRRLEETGGLTPKNLLDANREIGSPPPMMTLNGMTMLQLKSTEKIRPHISSGR